jgi:hypothetical protein
MGETWRSCISEHYGSTAPIRASHKDGRPKHPRRMSLVRRHWYVSPTHNSSSSLAATTTGSVLHTLALADGDCGLGVGGCGAHALLDLAGHGKESLLDVGSALCGRLEEWDAEAVCELLMMLLDTVRARGVMA